MGILVLASACDAYTGAKKGEEGNFGFYEPSTYPGDTATSSIGFDHAIALGARVSVWFTSPGLTSVTGVDIDRPDILNIESRVYPIVLRAQSAGAARLSAESSSGLTDAISLTVEPADDVRLGTEVVEPLFGPRDQHLGQGVTLRRGASATVAAQPLANGRRLLGYDFLEWAVDPELLERAGGASTVNTERFTALGQGGVAVVTTQFGGAYEIATIDDAEEPQLNLHRLSEDLASLDAIARLEPQDLQRFVLSGVDSEGRLVRPGPRDTADFAAEVTAGEVTVLEAKIRGHYATLRACPGPGDGTGTVELRYVGGRRAIAITVTNDVADPECP